MALPLHNFILAIKTNLDAEVVGEVLGERLGGIEDQMRECCTAPGKKKAEIEGEMILYQVPPRPEGAHVLLLFLKSSAPSDTVKKAVRQTLIAAGMLDEPPDVTSLAPLS